MRPRAVRRGVPSPIAGTPGCATRCRAASRWTRCSRSGIRAPDRAAARAAGAGAGTARCRAVRAASRKLPIVSRGTVRPSRFVDSLNGFSSSRASVPLARRHFETAALMAARCSASGASESRGRLSAAALRALASIAAATSTLVASWTTCLRASMTASVVGRKRWFAARSLYHSGRSRSGCSDQYLMRSLDGARSMNSRRRRASCSGPSAKTSRTHSRRQPTDASTTCGRWNSNDRRSGCR